MKNINELKQILCQSDSLIVTEEGKPNVQNAVVMAGIIDLAGMMLTTLYFEERGMTEKGSDDLKQILCLLANTRKMLGNGETWADDNLYLICRIVADLCESERAIRAGCTIPASIVADRICDDINATNEDPNWEDYSDEYLDYPEDY